MRIFPRLQWFVVLVALVMGVSAHAQLQRFDLLVTSTASSLLVSNPLTYTIYVTNRVGVLSDTIVSNTLTPSAQFVGATPSVGGSVTNFGNVTVFHLGGSIDGTPAKMTLTVNPTEAGFITNIVFVSAPSIFVTNTAATNVVTLITNITPPQVNLGVAIVVPATPVIVNDTVAYRVGVTNAGPDAAPSVLLTNTLPAGVILKSVSPTSPGYVAVSNNLIFNLGSVPSGGSASFQFTIQPTNAGILNCFASVGAASVVDTNSNHSASNTITVINYLPGTLVAVTNSAQIVNPQNGLIEQSILLSNVGTNSVPAVRLLVTSLTNRLFNASGTNSGRPFVVYANTLATNSSVTLLLQYAPRKNFPFTNSQLQAFAVPLPDLTPPVIALGTNIAYTRIVMLTNGLPLIEFPSTLGRTYTMVYSDNLLFSNALIAPPSIVAPANMVHWIDYGPPTTVSAPGVGSRYYRVYLNP